MRRTAALFVTTGAAMAVAACTLLVGTGDLSGDAVDASGGDAAPLADVRTDPIAADAAGEAGLDAGSDVRTYSEEVLFDKPVLYLRLEEKVGSIAKDEVTATHSAYFGTIEYGVPGAFAGSSAVRINGNSGYVLIGQRFHFQGTAPFTLEGWLKPDLYDPVYRALFSHFYEDDATGARESYAIFAHASDGICFERYVNDDFQVAQLKQPMPAAGQWHHLVGVYDGVTLLLYIDGVLAGSQTDTRSAPPTPNGSFSAGRLSEGSPSILGAMDELAIYDKALPAERVLAHWNVSRR